MAKKRRGSSRSFTIPLAAVAGVASGLASTLSRAAQGNPYAALQEFGRVMTGFDYTDGSWDWQRMKFGLFPILLGVGISIAASKFGINKKIARTGLPLLRV